MRRQPAPLAAAAPLRRRTLLLAAGAAGVAGCGPAGRGDGAAIGGGFAGTPPERGHLLRQPRPVHPAPVRRRAQVVVAGGGIAGLAAARALRLRGIEDIAVLELADAPGGNSRAGSVAGLPCPLGAHYLPAPGDNQPALLAFLQELGLRERVGGRWRWNERHLCHSPQERLHFNGQWQEGLLPLAGVGPDTLAQYRRFADAVRQAMRSGFWGIPAPKQPLPGVDKQLDATTFVAWLDARGLRDAHLRWYLDYCCRDDYGAGIATVSAWAGLHYFASRHGFHAPGDEGGGEADAVLTWPEGNGWLAQRLAQPLAGRLHCDRVVTRIAPTRGGVEVDALDAVTGAAERWQARHCVVALPAFVAARVLEGAPGFVAEAARATRYAPWLVANIHIRAPLADRPGAAPAWDNVLYGSAGLGYVDAGHQRLDPRPAPTVLTWYLAPGEAARAELLSQPWAHWQGRVLAELAVPHPDIRELATQVQVARWGHAMPIPVPGTRERIARAAPGLRGARISFAHSDWAGYSVFEEAFALGHQAGMTA